MINGRGNVLRNKELRYLHGASKSNQNLLNNCLLALSMMLRLSFMIQIMHHAMGSLVKIEYHYQIILSIYKTPNVSTIQMLSSSIIQIWYNAKSCR